MENSNIIEKLYVKVPILNDEDDNFQDLYGRKQSVEEMGVSQARVDVDHIAGYYIDTESYDIPVVVLITSAGDIYTALNEEQYTARLQKLVRVLYKIDTPLQAQ